MVTIKQRGQQVTPTESIQLISKFYDGYSGNLADLDSFPTISIIEPNGNVALTPTSLGVYRLAIGTYGFLYEVPYVSALGVFTDFWRGSLDGAIKVHEYNFVVMNGEIPALNTDGYISLGDPVGLNFSQNATNNINQFIRALKARLNSSGLAKTTDEFGNLSYKECDIFTVDQLVTFIATALSAFNQIPTFTEFTFEDNEILRIFFEVILQHALINALASKIAIERGRMLQITDNSVSFTPPDVSDVLMQQYNTELGNWFEKVKLIKANCKPGPLGVSSYDTLTNPRVRILRNTLRARQIF